MDHHRRWFTTWTAGFVALVHERLADATEHFDAAVVGGRESNDSNYMAGLLGLAWVCVFRGDFPSAHAGLAEARAATQRSWDDAVSVRCATGRPPAGPASHQQSS